MKAILIQNGVIGGVSALLAIVAIGYFGVPWWLWLVIVIIGWSVYQWVVTRYEQFKAEEIAKVLREADSVIASCEQGLEELRRKEK